MTFITSISSNLLLINQSSQLQYFSITQTTYFTSWLEYFIHPLVSEALQRLVNLDGETHPEQCSGLLWLIDDSCLYLCQDLGFSTDQGLKYAAINSTFVLVHQMKGSSSCFFPCWCVQSSYRQLLVILSESRINFNSWEPVMQFNLSQPISSAQFIW